MKLVKYLIKLVTKLNQSTSNTMAKAKVASKESHKISFGVRKKGKAQKRTNKHDRSEQNYKGQGR